MSKKKNKKDRGGFVFSTNPDFEIDDFDSGQDETLAPNQQNLKVRVDRLKGNKLATIVYNFSGGEDDLKDLGKTLKSKCGSGGSVKNGEILVQGDHRKKVMDELQKMNYKVKFSGG